MTGSLIAADTAQVRTTPPKNASPWIGEMTIFSITLLVEGQFAGAPTFDLPQVPSAFLMKVPGRPVVGSETIKGATYVSQIHEFRVFPQSDGEVAIPAIGARFGSKAVYNGPVVEHALTSDAWTLTPRTPKGWDGRKPVVSARSLKATETWEPDGVTELKVGDALVRKIRVETEDFPAMLLPEFTATRSDGFAVYPAQPRLDDKEDRGDLTSSREDRITYVCQQPGEFTLEAMGFRWWNTSTREWRTVEFEERTLTIAAAPGGVAGLTSNESRWSLFWIVAGCAVPLVVVFVFRQRIQQAVTQWNARRKQSEGYIFKELRKAARGGNAQTTYRQLGRWLAAANIDADDLSDDLSHASAALQQAVVTPNSGWDGKRLITAATALRHELSGPQGRKGHSSLAPLNP